MKPPPFRYHDPKTVSEAVGLLRSLENAKLLAGGQSLMPMLNMRFVLPDHIIDLNRVEGLSYIREAKGALEIGAMTRQRDLEFSDAVRARWPIMHEALLQVGHRQTRNRGTLGGSISNNDPAADYPAAVVGLNATVHTTKREIGADNFFTGMFETALEPRLYVHPSHVRTDLLRRTETSTYCNYKGYATYWSAISYDAVVEDIAWSYEDPPPESLPIKGFLSFDAARVDVLAELPPTPGS